MADQSSNDAGIWCVVANVKREHDVGEGGSEIKVGTKQFRGGAKVYIVGCFPGTCHAVLAIGLQRFSQKYIVCAVSVIHVENFRVKLVYHPRVIELIRQDDRCWIRTREEAEIWVEAFPLWQTQWEKKPHLWLKDPSAE